MNVGAIQKSLSTKEERGRGAYYPCGNLTRAAQQQQLSGLHSGEDLEARQIGGRSSSPNLLELLVKACPSV